MVQRVTEYLSPLPESGRRVQSDTRLAKVLDGGTSRRTGPGFPSGFFNNVAASKGGPNFYTIQQNQ